jgi:hypothetical protein
VNIWKSSSPDAERIRRADGERRRWLTAEWRLSHPAVAAGAVMFSSQRTKDLKAS